MSGLPTSARLWQYLTTKRISWIEFVLMLTIGKVLWAAIGLV